MPRYRDPKICWDCNTKQKINLYEARGKDKQYIISDEKAGEMFVLLIKGEGAERYMQKCEKCIWARPVETDIPLWWVSCNKCGNKIVSDKENICMKCG